MTIIIALKDDKNKKIILGSDQQVTAGVKELTSSKIIQIDLPVVDGYDEHIRTDKIYIATAGLAFLNPFIKYNFDAPSLKNNMDFIEYLQRDFLKKLRDELKEDDLVRIDSSAVDSESALIVVYNDELYEVNTRFAIELGNINSEYIVQGSGYREALGSLYTSRTLNPNINPKKQVKLAIQSACRYDLYCGGEPVIEEIPYYD